MTLAGTPPGPLALDGDLHLIERALTNLIDNALRHAPGAQAVRVSLRREGGQAQILVEDAGPGLPAELRDRLDAQQSTELIAPCSLNTAAAILACSKNAARLAVCTAATNPSTYAMALLLQGEVNGCAG